MVRQLRKRLLAMTACVVVASTSLVATVAPSASAWKSLGCVRGTDMDPATPNLDVYVAFVPGGHPDPGYYPSLGIDAANAWYGGVHNVILWKTPDGRSQVGVGATYFGNTGFAGIATKTATSLNFYACGGDTRFADDTWAQWNTFYTNTYSDNLNRAIMVHELGHAMGLAHEDAQGKCGAVMHTHVVSNYSGCQSWVPRWDDVYGIQGLYPDRA